MFAKVEWHVDMLIRQNEPRNTIRYALPHVTGEFPHVTCMYDLSFQKCWKNIVH